MWETRDIEILMKMVRGGHKKASGFRLPGDKHPDSIFDEEVEDGQQEIQAEATEQESSGSESPA